MILILDFGSQYTQLIARRIREQNVYCEIHPCNLSIEKIRAFPSKGIILSGGPNSVFEKDSPQIDPQIFDWGIPILGICYGMHLMIHLLGGKVENADHSEYGHAEISLLKETPLFESFSLESANSVWMSHGDKVSMIPDQFETVASSQNSPYAAIVHNEKKILGIQFHPEVAHTQNGTQILKNFIFSLCGCKPDWNMDSFLEEKIAQIRSEVGDRKVLCGLSGGVDSSVVAVLLHQAIGDQLVCVFVDTGLLRKGEGEKVVETFRKYYNIHLIHVDASKQFFEKLEGISDPEKKRKIIGYEFIEVFDEQASHIEGIEFLAQGTLYPDVIESISFKGPSATIKSHHNVGGLPEKMKLKLVEPLRELFKDEVRLLGKKLGLSDELVYRHPFPGPGLAVRIPGAIDREKVKILQDSDAILLEEIKKAGLYREIWQVFCVLVPVKTVGVMGDGRTYEWLMAIRSVNSTDAMTADWSRLPYDLLAKISNRIINEVPRVNRVVYDITSKPPGTIEWE